MVLIVEPEVKARLLRGVGSSSLDPLATKDYEALPGHDLCPGVRVEAPRARRGEARLRHPDSAAQSLLLPWPLDGIVHTRSRYWVRLASVIGNPNAPLYTHRLFYLSADAQWASDRNLAMPHWGTIKTSNTGSWASKSGACSRAGQV